MAVLLEVDQGTVVGLTTALGDLSGIVSVRAPRLRQKMTFGCKDGQVERKSRLTQLTGTTVPKKR